MKVRGQLLRESAVASGFRVRLRGPDLEVIVWVSATERADHGVVFTKSSQTFSARL